MTFLARPNASDPAIGGKARSLARLADAGLRVPSAFVVTGSVYPLVRAGGPRLPSDLASPDSLTALDYAAARVRQAALPRDLMTELAAAIDASGAERFSVRSSFAAEDRPHALAAGVYRSRTDVAASEVPRAVSDVLASALSPGAVAYARTHGTNPDAGPFAVLVHPFVPGTTGTAAWDPTHSTTPLIEPSAGLNGLARQSIEAACRTLAASMGAVELEWVASGSEVTFLQVRPYVAPTLPRSWSQRQGELAAGGWVWDAAHNPLPLSPAQAGLVELVDERCSLAFRQRVEGGYLFWAPSGNPPPQTVAPDQLKLEVQKLSAEIEVALTELGHEPALDSALDLFLGAYPRIFGVIQPAAARARHEMARFLDANLASRPTLMRELVAGVPSRATERLRLSDAIAAASLEQRASAITEYLDRFGDESPVWDVAAPTWQESPGPLEELASRSLPRSVTPAPERAMHAVTAALPPAAHAEWRRLLAGLRTAVATGEEDDWLYARLQAAVRRALLALGRRMAAGGQLLAPDDVFWLPLEWAMLAARGDDLPGDPIQTVRLARQQHLEELADPPPASWTRGADARVHELGGSEERVLRGTSASGGRTIGRVVIHRSGVRPPTNAVLVAPTLLPSELPLVAAAALVTESGHALDHVSAQARERGIPAVVATEGACRALKEGELVLVDADAGLVVRL